MYSIFCSTKASVQLQSKKERMKSRNKIYLYSQTTGYKLKTVVLKIILKNDKIKKQQMPSLRLTSFVTPTTKVYSLIIYFFAWDCTCRCGNEYEIE